MCYGICFYYFCLNSYKTVLSLTLFSCLDHKRIKKNKKKYTERHNQV